MKNQFVEAVFENGVFRPLAPIEPSLPEGRQVRLIVESQETEPTILDLAARVYEGLSEREVEEIETIALDRQAFFGTERPR